MQKLVVILLTVILAYLLLFPVDISPTAWKASDPPIIGNEPYQVTEEMTDLQRLFDHQCHKCEDIAIDKMGAIYGGQENGVILKFEDRNSEAKVFANTGGRPLGMMFNSEGELIVADADKGLLSIDSLGQIEVLSDNYNGNPFRFTDDLDIDSAGIIYFTDASRKFGFTQFKDDLMEHRPNGWFFSYNPNDKKTTLLMDSLFFANGVALSKNQDFVLVNETGKFRIKRLWLKGPLKGTIDIFKENLPAFNDGISSYNGDLFWVSMVSPRTKLLESLMPRPFLRKVVMRLPEFIQPAPEKFTLTIALDHNANVVHTLFDPGAKFSSIANVVPRPEGLYFGSLTDNGIGFYPFD